MLVQQVSRKIIRPLDPMSSNAHASFNRAVNTVIEMLCAVVSVEGLLCLEGSTPGAVRGFTGKSAWGVEDSQERGMGVPGRGHGSGGGGDVVLRVHFVSLICWLGIIGGAIPRAKD
ncbi:hypothetical protein HOY80DRAFT_1050199 [Tuber brumale]|nr:hypothetical protein HOY80DRAFT_1050199 [Tuber brumale]